MLALPALTLYLGFNAGGFFAGSTGWAAVAVALALALRIAVTGIATPPRPLLVAGSALALLTIWTLLSGSWSDNTGRALLEFDRTLLYLLVLALFGSIAAPREALRWLPLGLGGAAVVLCAAGFVTQALPEQWPWDLPAESGRLAYPITYPNGLGTLAALGMIACLHGAAWQRQPIALRAASAAALPLLAATLTLTFSRGAILALVVGALVYVGFGRSWGLPAALLAGVPAALLAVQQAYRADLIATNEPATAAAIDQGRELAVVVAVAMAIAAVALLALIPAERALQRRRRGMGLSRQTTALLLVIAAAATMVSAAVWLPDAVDGLREEIDRGGEASVRERLIDPETAGQNRVEYWRVSLETFGEEPLRGTGAGTFELAWARERPAFESVTEGHSVYLETLAELGLVGAALLLIVLGAMLVPFFRSETGERPLRAAAVALSVAWLLHAGVDWDWELPALTLWLFAFGGCALAIRPRGRVRRARAAVRAPAARGERPKWLVAVPRVAGVVACLLVALTPWAVARSQSRLDDSYAAYERGDCETALTLAGEASEILPPRDEPYEVRAYCLSSLGLHEEAFSAMDEAIERNPRSWELVYGLALLQALGGEDPRGTLREALELAPLEKIVLGASERITGDDPDRWRRMAEQSAFPFP